MAETVLVTGASGFIAKHVVLALLNAGHTVRGTVRRLDRGGEVRIAVDPHLKDSSAIRRLEFVAADLESDRGWAQAMVGVTAVLHTASPFPIAEPRDPQVVIRPAVDGTRRVLTAAADAGVRRVVLTSSTAAVLDRRRGRVETEEDWADPKAPGASPYAQSKVLAERAAWEIAGDRGLMLTAINPGFVLGPPLDRNFGSSIGLVRRMMAGKDPMVPAIGFPVVDVRDVAVMHLRALENPATAGKRYIAAAGSMWMAEMGAVLKAAYPGRRIATRVAPALAMRAMALFDREIRSVLPYLGHIERVSSARAVAEMGMDFIPPEAALKASADWLVRHGIL